MKTNCSKCGRPKDYHFGKLQASAGCTGYVLKVKLPQLEKLVLLRLYANEDPRWLPGSGHRGMVAAALKRLQTKGLVMVHETLTVIGTDVTRGMLP